MERSRPMPQQGDSQNPDEMHHSRSGDGVWRENSAQHGWYGAHPGPIPPYPQSNERSSQGQQASQSYPPIYIKIRSLMEEQDLQGHHPGIGEFQPSEGVYTYDPSAERVTEEGAALHQLFWYACAYDPSAERITEEGAAFFQQGEIPSAYVESEERITEEGSPRYLRTTDGLQSAHMSPLERKTDDLHKPRKVRTTEGSRPSRRQRVHKNTHSLASLRDRHIALKKRKAREQRALKTLRSERRRKIFHPSVNIQPEMQIAGLSIDNSPPIESTTADPAVGSNPSVIDSLVYAFGD